MSNGKVIPLRLKPAKRTYKQGTLALVPVHHCIPLEVEKYWKDLDKAGRLEPRWYAERDPGWPCVYNTILAIQKGTYPALMYMLMNDDRQIIAELTLDNILGKAAQSHFSVHPDLSYSDTIDVGKDAVAIILTAMVESATKEPMLYTLYGLTPLSNKAACILALKTGYKKMGVLPKSAHLINQGGLYDDCQMSLITRDDLIGE